MSMFFEHEADESPAAGPEPRRGSRARRYLVRTLAALLVTAGVGATAAALYVGSVSETFTSSLHREDMLPTGRPEVTAGTSTTTTRDSRPPRTNTKALNFVLMGSDSRDPQDPKAGRSDTLMVMHLAADRRSAYLVSFPRDMYVPIPGHGKNKINAAYSYGGVPLAVDTLEHLLDTRMDHVAVIDFDGFTTLTNQLDGVTVYNAHESRSRGYTFPRGKITIKGDEALAFVRERYELPRGDLDRAERQRLVVQAILKKVISADVLTDPVEFTSVVAGMADNVTVDRDLTDSKIRKIALSVRLGAEDIEMLQAPIAGFGTVGGQSIDVVDKAGIDALGKALRDDEMADYLRDRPGR